MTFGLYVAALVLMTVLATVPSWMRIGYPGLDQRLIIPLIVSSFYFPAVMAATILRVRFREIPDSPERRREPAASGADAAHGGADTGGVGEGGVSDHDGTAADRRRTFSFWVVTWLISVIVVVSLLSGQLTGGIALSGLLLTIYQLWLDRF